MTRFSLLLLLVFPAGFCEMVGGPLSLKEVYFESKKVIDIQRL